MEVGKKLARAFAQLLVGPCLDVLPFVLVLASSSGGGSGSGSGSSGGSGSGGSGSNGSSSHHPSTSFLQGFFPLSLAALITWYVARQIVETLELPVCQTMAAKSLSMNMLARQAFGETGTYVHRLLKHAETYATLLTTLLLLALHVQFFFALKLDSPVSTFLVVTALLFVGCLFGYCNEPNILMSIGRSPTLYLTVLLTSLLGYAIAHLSSSSSSSSLSSSHEVFPFPSPHNQLHFLLQQPFWVKVGLALALVLPCFIIAPDIPRMHAILRRAHSQVMHSPAAVQAPSVHAVSLAMVSRMVGHLGLVITGIALLGSYAFSAFPPSPYIFYFLASQPVPSPASPDALLDLPTPFSFSLSWDAAHRVQGFVFLLARYFSFFLSFYFHLSLLPSVIATLDVTIVPPPQLTLSTASPSSPSSSTSSPSASDIALPPPSHGPPTLMQLQGGVSVIEVRMPLVAKLVRRLPLLTAFLLLTCFLLLHTETFVVLALAGAGPTALLHWVLPLLCHLKLSREALTTATTRPPPTTATATATATAAAVTAAAAAAGGGGGGLTSIWKLFTTSGVLLLLGANLLNTVRIFVACVTNSLVVDLSKK